MNIMSKCQGGSAEYGASFPLIHPCFIEDTSLKILRLLIPFFRFAVAAAQPGPAGSCSDTPRCGWVGAAGLPRKVTATGEAIASASFEATIKDQRLDPGGGSDTVVPRK